MKARLLKKRIQPITAECIGNKMHRGLIVSFAKKWGTVIKSGDSSLNVGFSTNTWQGYNSFHNSLDANLWKIINT
jgi:hypothetical protein